MTRRVKFTILESGISAIADMYERDAPRTVDAMWIMLEKAYEAQTIHGIFEGRKITLEPPTKNRNFDPNSIPQENTTAYPVEGDVLWKYYPPNAVRGLPYGLWDVMVIYGPEAILKNSLGITPCNLWAHITENLSEFASVCSDIRINGSKTVRVSRFEG